MRVIEVTIENYKSLGEKHNILYIQNCVSLVGRNESGKTNIVEALYNINMNQSGFSNKEYFNCKNKINLKNPKLKIKLEPYEFEKEEYKKLSLTEIEINDIYDISFKGGLSDEIKFNTEIIKLKDRIIEITSEKNIYFNDLIRTGNYHELLKNIENIENKVFINYSYINGIVSDLKNSKEDIKRELAENIVNLKDKLFSMYKLFPRFLFIDNVSIKSVYKREEIKANNSKEVTVFEKMLKIAGLELKDIEYYWQQNDDAIKKQLEKKYNKMLNEKVIKGFNKFYSQETLNIELDFKTDSVNILINSTDTLMKFSERSNGLIWYFNVYVKMASEKLSNKNVIYILDEPGTFLHVNAQKELLKFFKDLSSKDNQVIYTTHSPYMIDQNNLQNVRLVIKDKDGYTEIHNKYHHFPKKHISRLDTLTPIIDALGFDIKYNFGPNNNKVNIIVEGISDYYYWKAYFIQKKYNEEQIPNIIPSTGVDNINRLVSIMIGWGCNYKIIVDNDDEGRKEFKVLTEKLKVELEDISFTDGTNIINENCKHTIESVFSEKDYEDIVNKEGYEDAKSIYSFEVLKNIENGSYFYTDETLNNFEKILINLGIQL